MRLLDIAIEYATSSIAQYGESKKIARGDT
jgi:hypothetical protein